MPIVPFGKSQNGNQGSGPAVRPSETDLLLALAEMHRQGRFKTAAAEKMPFIDPTEIERRGYGTPAEGTAWARSKGMSRDEAREFVREHMNIKEGDVPPEVWEEWKKSKPSDEPGS